jgi:hypothetical protein
MKRLALLGAAGLIGMLPNLASAHSRFFVGLGVGVPFIGFRNAYCFAPAYCALSCYAPAPAVVYSTPVVYAPPVCGYPTYYYHAPAHRAARYYYYYRR